MKILATSKIIISGQRTIIESEGRCPLKRSQIYPDFGRRDMRGKDCDFFLIVFFVFAARSSILHRPIPMSRQMADAVPGSR